MQNYKEKILKQLEYQKDYINQTTYENNQSDLELITKIEKFIKKCSNLYEIEVEYIREKIR